VCSVTFRVFVPRQPANPQPDRARLSAGAPRDRPVTGCHSAAPTGTGVRHAKLENSCRLCNSEGGFSRGHTVVRFFAPRSRITGLAHTPRGEWNTTARGLSSASEHGASRGTRTHGRRFTNHGCCTRRSRPHRPACSLIVSTVGPAGSVVSTPPCGVCSDRSPASHRISSF